MPPNFGQFTDIFRQMGISDPYNQSSIAAALSSQTGQTITPSMVASLTPQMMEASQAQTYQPYIQQGTQNLLTDLIGGIGGKQGIQAAGGFAGTAGYGQQVAQARDVYGKGAIDVLGNVSHMRAQGAQSVQDIISSWREMMQQVKYG